MDYDNVRYRDHRDFLEVAVKLSDELFGDMELREYPALEEELDYSRITSFLDYVSLRIEFFTEKDEDDTNGEYDRKNARMAIYVDPATGRFDVTVLAHEMIHHYIHELEELDPSLLQYLTAKLWEKLSAHIPDLNDRALKFLEVTDHNDLEANGGSHDLLFMLKSYDVDLMLELPLGTTFGYGGHVA